MNIPSATIREIGINILSIYDFQVPGRIVKVPGTICMTSFAPPPISDDVGGEG